VSDEQFTQTPAYAALCRSFNVPVAPDAAAHLGHAEQAEFFEAFDASKASLEG
jgi:hypothetical protein